MSEPKESDYDPVQSSTDHDADDTHPAFVGADDLFIRNTEIRGVVFPELGELTVRVYLSSDRSLASESAEAAKAFRSYLT
jgi:hypothetical protein